MQRSHSVIGTVLCAITNGEINHDPDQTILTVCACRQNPSLPLSLSLSLSLSLHVSRHCIAANLAHRAYAKYIRIYVGD